MVLLLGLSGCAFVFQDFDESEGKNLKVGMPKEEVTQALGVPQSQDTAKIEGQEYEVWVYLVNASRTRMIKPLGAAYLKVYFLNGKLSRWGREKIYANPSYKPIETHPPR